MKKIIILFVSLLLHSARTSAQPTVTLLQSIDTAYNDLKMAPSGSCIAGLRYGTQRYQLELRSNTGNDLGTILHTTDIGDSTSYFTNIEMVNDYVYAYGFNLQAIHIGILTAPVKGPIFPVRSYPVAAAHWSNFLYILNSKTATQHMLNIYSLANPLVPQLVDSMFLPQNANMKVWGNHLYYLQLDDVQGNKIVAYTLNSMPPYVTLGSTLLVNNQSSIYAPAMDIIDNQLIAVVADSLYRYRINVFGGLQRISARPNTVQMFDLVAKDTAILCYAEYRKIYAQYLNNPVKEVDSTNIFSFDSFQDIGKLGNNIFYTSLGKTRLVRLTDQATGMVQVANARFSIYPNPTRGQWTVTASIDGVLDIYSGDGKLMIRNTRLQARAATAIDATTFPAGMYYITIVAADGKRFSRQVIKY